MVSSHPLLSLAKPVTNVRGHFLDFPRSAYWVARALVQGDDQGTQARGLGGVALNCGQQVLGRDTSRDQAGHQVQHLPRRHLVVGREHGIGSLKRVHRSSRVLLDGQSQ